MLNFRFKNNRHPANVFIMLVAFVIFGFLMGLSYSIGQLKMTNLEQHSVKTIKTKLDLINNSGLSEVIANRLFPTSNRYSWQFDNVADISTTADPILKPKPFLNDSGYVYETISNVEKAVGRYQYIILGVNPYFDYNPGSGAYTVSTAKMDSGEHLYNIENPLYVIVRSFLCFDDATSTIAYDSVKSHTVSPYAICQAGQTLKTNTTLTEMRVTNPPIPTLPTDSNTQIEIVSSQQIQPETTITLPSYILNRNNLSTNQLNFEDWWTNRVGGIHYGVIGNAVPVGIRYTKIVSSQPVRIYLPWTSNPMTLPNDALIPSLEILFRSAIDERSLYVAIHPGNGSSAYGPKNTIYMNIPDPEFPTYLQQDFSATILRKSGVEGLGYLTQELGFPSLSLLKISGSVPCSPVPASNPVVFAYDSNEILFNSKGQLRDADGFKNSIQYRVRFPMPEC